MAGKIKIDFEKCKACGLCIAVCPKNSIIISKKSNKGGYFPAEAKNIDCTGCCACALICPDAAIVVYRDEPDKQKKTTSAEVLKSTGTKSKKDK
jgi:2-oxoglutarate ferredoxin oxidoreductase subunit delta